MQAPRREIRRVIAENDLTVIGMFAGYFNLKLKHPPLSPNAGRGPRAGAQHRRLAAKIAFYPDENLNRYQHEQKCTERKSDSQKISHNRNIPVDEPACRQGKGRDDSK
ncbi:hypothetical protein GCM10010909_31540 [Acidocella aquatica]|uniref:Uncharacterized protein n=1 Tax=Acidocella aquatica TaxID=1922313 RepID=A0ABQ6AAY9_9PROT|nr:hypothetical protein GCM10010909_31540 [Acidocella aquatica]